MNCTRELKNIIKSGKWVRNDIGMGRVQYCKIINMNEELILIIASDSMEIPLFSRVENILVVNDEIIVFYDGEYAETIQKDEYEDFRDYINKKEWDIIFAEDAGGNLEEAGLVSSKSGFYAEVHETISAYMDDGYDEEATEELCEQFNIF